MNRIGIAFTVFLFGLCTAAAEDEPETRTIVLKHLWTGEKLEVAYKVGDDYDAKALASINSFMRDWRCDRVIEIDPQLIDLLWELTQELNPKGPLKVISGYRSRGLNLAMKRQGRKVAIRSEHSNGTAVDVVFPGVPAEKVREAALAHNVGGVGYYPHSGPPFVHLDTGKVRQWAQLKPDDKKQSDENRSAKPLECSESYQTPG